MTTISDYLSALVSQKNALAENLVTQGVSASSAETLNTLVPKVLDIEVGGGGPEGAKITVKAQGDIKSGDPVSIYQPNGSYVEADVPHYNFQDAWYDGTEYIYHHTENTNKILRTPISDMTQVEEYINNTADLNNKLNNGVMDTLMRCGKPLIPYLGEDGSVYLRNVITGADSIKIMNTAGTSIVFDGYGGKSYRYVYAKAPDDTNDGMWDITTGEFVSIAYGGYGSDRYLNTWVTPTYKFALDGNGSSVIVYKENTQRACAFEDESGNSINVFRIFYLIGNYAVGYRYAGLTTYTQVTIVYFDVYDDVDFDHSKITIHDGPNVENQTGSEFRAKWNCDGSLMIVTAFEDTYVVDQNANFTHVGHLSVPGAVYEAYFLGDYIKTSNVMLSGATPIATRSNNNSVGALGWAPFDIAAGETGEVIHMFDGGRQTIRDDTITNSIVDRTITEVNLPTCESIGSSAFAYFPSLTAISFPACTSIGTYAFYSCSSLTAISFPACTSIGTYAFRNCYSLTTASFPVCTSIENCAFYYCSSLTTISFPACTSIGSSAFYSCSRLTTASFPACTSIGNGAFYNCYSLTTASFPVCTSIGNSAFCSCSSLTTISFPVCTSIGNYAFYYCSSLTTASFPVCTSIGSSVFYSCSRLTTASFPVCTSIGSSVFYYCSRLTTISFPVCTSIGDKAFYNCYSLTTISFPACTSIGSSAFYGCSKLESLYLGKFATFAGGALDNTPMVNSWYLDYYGSIYVPESLYSSYITAMGWSSLSARIVSYTS